jgi:hypothetical protein
MSESTEALRRQIAAEREGLGEDVEALRAEVRSLVPLAAIGIAVVALVTFRSGAKKGVGLLWKLF